MKNIYQSFYRIMIFNASALQATKVIFLGNKTNYISKKEIKTSQILFITLCHPFLF